MKTHLEPKEIFKLLHQFGIRISRNTLYNFEQYGVIEPAEYRNSNTVLYPILSVIEIIAMEKLRGFYKGKMRIGKDMIAEVRGLAYAIERRGGRGKDMQNPTSIEEIMAQQYLIFKDEAEYEIEYEIDESKYEMKKER
jgi:hypothetical protein